MITYVIIGVTVVVSYICFGNHELFRKLAFIPYCTVHNREWYRLITHGFVHADMTHLLVNMFTFWSFGTYMESAFGYLGLGTGGYLGLYFGGMVAASLYDLIRRRNDPYYVSIGASGAVSAVHFHLPGPVGQDFVFCRTADSWDCLWCDLPGLLPVYGKKGGG